MSRAKHARRTPTKALIAVGAVILASMALVTPRVMATQDSSTERTPAIVKLPRLDGRPTQALAVNDHGVAVGFGEDEHGNVRAVVWRDGRIHVLDNLPGGTSAEAHDINNRGQIVGLAETQHGTPHAVLWESNGSIRDLGTLRGQGHHDDISLAAAINDAGQVVGSSHYSDDDNLHAFVWENGRMRDLGLPGAENLAAGINNHGDIVGSHTGEGTRAYLLRHGGELVTLANNSSYAFAINKRAEVVGALEFQFSAPDLIATLWSPEVDYRPQDLRTGEGNGSVAVSINDRGDLVGSRFSRSDSEAVLWERRRDGGQGFSLLPPLHGHDFAEANDINNHGVIVGVSVGSEGADPVLWR